MDINHYLNQVLHGDNREIIKSFPDSSVDCVVTSPPYYGLRDYGGIDDQIGVEEDYTDYINNIIMVMMEIHRVLKPTGTLWLNMNDVYAGSRKGGGGNGWNDKCVRRGGLGGNRDLLQKSLMLLPWRIAIKMVDELGFILRQDNIWYKLNCLPESVKDRTTRGHEYILHFTKERDYFYEQLKEKAVYKRNYKVAGSKGQLIPNRRMRDDVKIEEARELRNMRSIWQMPSSPGVDGHYATFPLELANRCIVAGCPKGGIVLDPFMGSGTTGIAAVHNGCRYIGIDTAKEYVQLAKKRIEAETKQLSIWAMQKG